MMPPFPNIHHCKYCDKTYTEGFCPTHQTVCTGFAPLTHREWVHYNDEPCSACRAAREGKEDREQKEKDKEDKERKKKENKNSLKQDPGKERTKPRHASKQK